MKIIEIVTDKGHLDTLRGIADQQEVRHFWASPEDEEGRVSVRMLVGPDKRQKVIDAAQTILDGSASDDYLMVIPVEAMLPRPEAEPDKTPNGKKNSVGTTREEIFNTVEKGARLDWNYIVLVMLSTVVAAIGLLENNIAVVIGAMVIAPLLGPNIALALATALGDTELGWNALKAITVGLVVAILISILIGMIWPLVPDNPEILSRTEAGYSSAALALASGAAAVLSLTTGLPSVLVGVMVAVALLPPAATVGLMLGTGQIEKALGAILLLAVNIVCVNLAAKLVFLFRGVKPRTWLEKRKARQSTFAYLAFWIISLAVLIAVIYQRQ